MAPLPLLFGYGMMFEPMSASLCLMAPLRAETNKPRTCYEAEPENWGLSSLQAWLGSALGVVGKEAVRFSSALDKGHKSAIKYL